MFTSCFISKYFQSRDLQSQSMASVHPKTQSMASLGFSPTVRFMDFMDMAMVAVAPGPRPSLPVAFLQYYMYATYIHILFCSIMFYSIYAVQHSICINIY